MLLQQHRNQMQCVSAIVHVLQNTIYIGERGMREEKGREEKREAEKHTLRGEEPVPPHTLQPLQE